MTTNQEGRQAAIRSATSTAYNTSSDWHALFDQAGIDAGTWTERMLAWINQRLGTSYTNINGAMHAYADNFSYDQWHSIATILLSEASQAVAGEANALSLDFTDDYFKATTGFNGSAYVLDASNGDNNFDGTPDDLLTYTTTSVKTITGSDGLLKYAPHNLQLNSQTFDSVTWTCTLCTPTDNAATAPDGTQTAALIEPSGNGQIIGTNIVTGDITASRNIWMRSVSGEFNIRLRDANDGTQSTTCGLTTEWQKFTLDSSVAGGTSGTTAIWIDDLTIGNDFYIWGAHVHRTPADTSYVPTTTAAAYALPYDHYTSGTLRGILVEPAATNLLAYSQIDDGTQWTETNVTNTTNAATSPSGETDATLITASAGGGIHSCTDQYSCAAAVTSFAISCYLKAGTTNFAQLSSVGTTPGINAQYVFNLSDGTVAQTINAGDSVPEIESVGDGWYRIIIFDTSDGDAGNPNVTIGPHDGTASATWTAAGTETIYAWQGQAETGSSATSLIKTYGATATRAGDDVTLATSSMPFAGGEAGSTMIEFNTKAAIAAPGYTQALYSITDGTLTNRYLFPFLDNQDVEVRVVGGVSGVSSSFSAGVSAGTVQRLAEGLDTNDYAASLDGATAITDGTVDIPSSVNELSLGTAVGSVDTFLGHIRKFIFTQRRVSNADLVSWSDTGDLPDA